MTGPLVPVIYFPGSGSSPSGLTAFGLFDDDDEFVEDAPKVAKWVAYSLGYPVQQVELTSQIIYIQFEQAICEFGSQVNQFNIRENMLALQGISTGSSVTQTLIKSSPLPMIIEMSQMYGTEAGVGGLVDFKKGNINMKYNVQDYDLQALWAAVSESGNRIEIRRIWHERVPAINRFFDPFAGGAAQGAGIENLLGEFGFGGYSVASQYLLMPVYETLLRVQSIELNDQIRRSQYSFEIKNNKLRIFPIPEPDDDNTLLWFEYTVTKDKFAAQLPTTTTTINGVTTTTINNGGLVSDYSNVPYDFIQYSFINDIGRKWIWNLTLALCKIVLGTAIRSKYENIPIPDSEITLNGLAMAEEGRQEVERLMDQLRETLEASGKSTQMQKAVENEKAVTEILRGIPMPIYIF